MTEITTIENLYKKLESLIIDGHGSDTIRLDSDSLTVSRTDTPDYRDDFKQLITLCEDRGDIEEYIRLITEYFREHNDTYDTLNSSTAQSLGIDTNSPLWLVLVDRFGDYGVNAQHGWVERTHLLGCITYLRCILHDFYGEQ